MSYDALQTLVIVIAVAASALHATRSLAPKALRTLRIRVAAILLRPRRNAAVRLVGRWLAPQPASASAGCGSACSGCDDAGSATPR